MEEKYSIIRKTIILYEEIAFYYLINMRRNHDLVNQTNFIVFLFNIYFFLYKTLSQIYFYNLLLFCIARSLN